MKRPIGNPVSSLVLNRQLIWQLTRREFATRYQGSMLGMFWAVIQPLLLLSVYSFVFSKIFPSRWGDDRSPYGFVSMLFCGIIIHGFFSECINRAPLVVLSQISYVKRVIFPLEILPIVIIGSAMCSFSLNLVILMALVLVQHHALPLTAVFFFPIFFAFSLFVAGLSWLLASLGVYLRDIAQITGILTVILMFLSPVFYPASSLPEPYRYFMLINPLTFAIEESRKVLLLGAGPNWGGLLIYAMAGGAVAGLGYAWFQRTRNGFADVI